MTNSVATLTHFVRALNVPVTTESIDKGLTKHPDYLSLFAISDLLNNWKVPNASYEVNLEDLKEIPCPFIAVTTEETFLLVNHIDEKSVTISNERLNNHLLDLNAFSKLYGGIVLIAEPEEDSGEENYSKKMRQKFVNEFRLPFVLSGLFIILVTAMLQHSTYVINVNWQIGLLSLFKSAGLVTSILLLMHSIDRDNPIVKSVCTGLKSDCNSILSSNAAVIFDGFSWSEAGFFYFSGTWLVLLFNTDSIALMQILAILNLFCLPYTFYSIYYQAKVAKRWCIFCCTIQALFWLEFFSFFTYLTQPIHMPGPGEWSTLFICMALPVMLWIFTKPYLLKAKQLEPVKQQFDYLKYNPAVVSGMFNAESKHSLLDEEHTINLIGNPNAKNTITMASNPYCTPCAAAYKFLDKWLDTRDDFKLQIVFHANTTDNVVWPLAHDLLSLKKEKGDAYIKQAYDDWYALGKNYTTWSKRYPSDNNISNEESIKLQKEWCRNAGINGTPELFINGRRIPKPYKVEDLRYFIQ